MSARKKLNVRDFPRPPLLEKTPRHLVVKWGGDAIVDTKDGYWALETTHPPTYYMPPSAVSSSFELSAVPNKGSLCEWKGRATYYSITKKSTNETVSNRIFSYDEPTPRFKDIKGYLSFYASEVPWECFVDGEKAEPQEGIYYSGWKTSELEGAMKGGPGTWGW